MKKAEFLKRVESGECLILAEWRGGEVKSLSGVSAKGKPYNMSRIDHRLEIGGEQVGLSERLPDGTKAEGYVFPFKKGDQVAVALKLRDGGAGKFYVDGTFSRVE